MNRVCVRLLNEIIVVYELDTAIKNDLTIWHMNTNEYKLPCGFKNGSDLS